MTILQKGLFNKLAEGKILNLLVFAKNKKNAAKGLAFFAFLN